jgi:mannosidase alpha-like ER degradation enhancer 2
LSSSSQKETVPIKEQQQQQYGILESLWSSFKQTLETATTKRQEQKQQESFYMPQQKHPQGASSRRNLLFEQALTEHYTRQLLDSTPELDDREAALEQQPQQQQGTQPTFQARSQSPLRWVRRTSDEGDDVCHYYSETSKSYWSYEWCPEQTFQQGFRNKAMSLEPKHDLGTYEFDFMETKTKARQPQQQPQQQQQRRPTTVNNQYKDRFYSDLQTRYPTARVELYGGGDLCEGGGEPQVRRITGVIIHQEPSTNCPVSSTKELLGPMIESVEETLPCRYIVHVCTPATISAQSKGDDMAKQRQPEHISDPDTQQIGQTMHHIHDIMDMYLHQSQSTQLQKAHPDRITSLQIGMPPIPPSRVVANVQLIRDMFTHAYDGYMYHAYPASEIKPISCKPAVFNLVKIPALTLIDSLDMLMVLGNYTEFARSVERLRSLHKRMAEDNMVMDSRHGGGGLFALNQNVSVFETNIRVLGGLLSAHQLAEAYISNQVREKDVYEYTFERLILIGPVVLPEICQEQDEKTEESLLECDNNVKPKNPTCQNRTVKFWLYDGFLLELAQDIGNRLLPAFDTKTGIPYGTVNLLSGIPKGETTIASLAGGGTLSLEMELLSRLTGDPSYGQAAKLAARALWMRRSRLELFGKHICSMGGGWTESLSGIGSNSDSYYEYLIKHHILFPEDPDFWLQMVTAYGGVYDESRLGEWYADVDMSQGSNKGSSSSKRVLEALMAFYPGMQVLLGELTPAARTLNSFFMVREFLGFLPERFNFAQWKVEGSGGKHHLRPELLESAYFLHRATKGIQQQSRRNSNATMDGSGWQWAADFSLHALERHTRATCGYASVKDLSPTISGAIGTAGPQNQKVKLMDEMPSFFLSETLKYLYLTFDEDNVLHTDQEREWIFTTEAHPIHYAPHKNDEENALNELKERVKDRLRSRIKGEKQGPKPSPQRLLKEEKWSEKSKLDLYVQSLEPVIQKVALGAIAREREAEDKEDVFGSRLLDTFLAPGQIYLSSDFFNETRAGTNLAHLTFRKEGLEKNLRKSCPNFYSSDFLWIRALNGGATDYADAYMSSSQDEEGESNARFHMLGSIEALALYGAGVHVVEYFDRSQFCPIYEKESEVSKAEPRGDFNQNQQTGQAGQNGKDRFDLGGELGSFEVSAFPGGSGFYIQHVDSSETIITTIIKEEPTAANIESFVMIYATPSIGHDEQESSKEETKPASWRLSNSRLASLFSRGEEAVTDFSDLVPQRSVVMADLKGNSFACRIEVLHYVKLNPETAPLDETEIVLARYPCAPALFGPTHMTELVSTNGLVVESVIEPPEIGNEYGCSKTGTEVTEDEFLPAFLEGEEGFSPEAAHLEVEEEGTGLDADSSGEDSCRAEVVQVLHRGVCTFQDKAMNQKDSVNAKAVIMINTEDDELFVMSGGTSGDDDNTIDDTYPATVLVTGADGQDIIELIDTANISGIEKVITRVSLVKQDPEIEETGGVYAIIRTESWPAVRASSEALQIFAEGGWAIHAVQKPGKTESDDLDWQLYLMRHVS